MERILKKNYWDDNAVGNAAEGPVDCVRRDEVMQALNAAEGPVDCVRRDEVMQALNEMKTGEAHGHSDISLEFVAASREIGIQVMAEIS